MAWMIMQYGFISAVEYQPQRDSTHQLPDSLKAPRVGASRRERKAFRAMVADGFILARARVKDDLEQLRKHFDGLTIVKDSGADYQWRAVVPRKAFAEWAYDEAMNIDYHSHFKEVARERSPKDDNRYPAMLACWGQLNRMGGPRTYGGAFGYGAGGYVGGPNTYKPFTGKSGKHNATDSLKRGSGRQDYNFDWDAWKERQQTLLDGEGDPEAPLHDPLAEEFDLPPVAPSETDTLIGMVDAILEAPLNDVSIDEHTPDDPYDLWIAMYDTIGDDRAGNDVVSLEEIIEVIDAVMADNADNPEFDSVAWDEVRLELVDRTLDRDAADTDIDQPVNVTVNTEVEEA